VSVSRKLTFASYCFFTVSETDILLYSACMYIPLVLKLTMHSIRKFLIHIKVFSVIHSIALDKLLSDMHSYTFCLTSTTSFLFVVKMPGAHITGAHMPGARTVHPAEYSFFHYARYLRRTAVQLSKINPKLLHVK
jgi:hypothetical protein